MNRFLYNANFSVLAFSEKETFRMTKNIVHVQLILFQYIWISILFLSFSSATNNQTNLFPILHLSNNMIEDKEKVLCQTGQISVLQESILLKSAKNILLGFKSSS